MFGFLVALIFGVAALDDVTTKASINAKNKASWTADGKPYYPTADNYYIYIPTGEKCYIATEYTRAGSERKSRKVLKTVDKINNPSHVVYRFPEVDRCALLRARMKELGWATIDDMED